MQAREKPAEVCDGPTRIAPVLRLTAIVPATNAPPTLAACLEAIRGADEPPEEVIVATEGRSVAEMRNRGAYASSGDVLVFVDADVLPHADAFSRIRRAFEEGPGLVALFGSYDDSPADPGVVSAFRNLLHHHVHHASAGPATTFWTGLGAVRRPAFLDVGGFDPDQRWLEDVDLGIRLARAGGEISLDPRIQGTHLKAWSFWEMVRTDFARRGVPWVGLLLRHGAETRTLNLGWRHRASALASRPAAWALLRRRPRAATAALAALAALNAPFYVVLARRRGPLEATLGLGLHAVHHITGVLSIPAGVAAHLRRPRPPAR
jgi:GT2 family glycosyltransferase